MLPKIISIIEYNNIINDLLCLNKLLLLTKLTILLSEILVTKVNINLPLVLVFDKPASWNIITIIVAT